MNADLWLAGGMAALLFIYLLIALFRAEEMS
ncbi:potassium-transporting ATPase subunit F [Uliginosibacterium sp. sgz301328]